MEQQATQTQEAGQAVGRGNIDDRENLRNIDIPDAKASKKPGKEPVSAEVQQEGNLRQYIRPDGVFIKDLPSLRILQRATGRKNKVGAPVMENKYTQSEANRLVAEMCLKSGRKMETDQVSGRPKAVPGWNMTIRVPGHENSEQYAPNEPEGAAREKIRDNAMLTVQEDNAALRKEMAELKETINEIAAGTVAAVAATNKGNVKDTKDMNVFELQKYAKDNEFDLGTTKKKPEMLAVIDRQITERNENES